MTIMIIGEKGVKSLEEKETIMRDERIEEAVIQEKSGTGTGQQHLNFGLLCIMLNYLSLD